MKFLISFLVGLLLAIGALFLWLNVKAVGVEATVPLTKENCLTTIKYCKCR